MKIIIAGAGEVGTHLAKMLSSEKHDITIIDNDEENLKNIESTLDCMTVHGSSTSISVLRDANIKKTDLLLAVAHFEETNLTTAILGKKLGAEKVIARIDNQEYLFPENKDYIISLGIDYLIYPEKIAAREVVGLLHRTGTTEVFEFSGGRLSLFVIKLDENAPIINKTLAESSSKNNKDYRAVAITRQGNTIIPRGNDVFLANDQVYVITNVSGIEELMTYSGKEEFHVKNIMILGGSRIGKTIAKDLEGQFNIKLIELDRDKSFKLADYLHNTLVINGDGRNADLLVEEGLKNMDTFIAVTGDSEVNILSCLLAKNMGVKKTIAEIENLDYITLAEKMGIDNIINKKLIAASRIFRFTMNTEVNSIKCLTGTEAEVLEFTVKPGSKATKAPIRSINFPKDSIIGGIVRGKSSFVAMGDTQIKPNDKVVVFALPSAINIVGEFFN